MKRRVVSFAAVAKHDIEAIYDWIADSGSAQNALSFIDRIERYCLSFDLAAERGRVVQETAEGDVRAVGFRRQATIVFRVEADAVTILRIHRAGLDWLAELEG